MRPALNDLHRLARHAVTLLLIVSAFGNEVRAAPDYEPSGSPKRRVELGGAFALSGNAIAFGVEEQRGALLAIEEVNRQGRLELSMTVEDTGSTGLGTTTAVKRLVEARRLDLIVGPTWLDSFQGALPVADRNEALLVTPSAGVLNFKKSAQDFPLAISTYFCFEREIEALLQAVRSKGIDRIAMLFDLDPYFEGMRTLAEKQAASLGITIVYVQSFAPGTSDFRTLLGQVAQRGAQGILFGSVDEQSVLAFLRQRKERLPRLALFGTHDLEAYRQNQAFSSFFKNLSYVIPAGVSPEFVSLYEARFGEVPKMSASNAYDAVMVIAQALDAGNTSPSQIREYLLSHEFYTQTFGRTGFSELGGITQGSFQMVVVE